MNELHYDYHNQCWCKDGKVLKCGHRQVTPGCFPCVHAGEPHVCHEDCGPVE